MCCFSAPVQHVSDTNIFARLDAAGRQFIIYSMSLSAEQDLAMILPIPVKEGAGEKAVTFINLEKYPRLFEDMIKGFPVKAYSAGLFGAAPRGIKSAPLPVVRVGAFDASYVPTAADFTRLDARFRLPDGTWEKLPGYNGFGFAVFKLHSGKQDVHPMAFSFPSAVPDRLFFPTMHIHDGEVHKKADFDHALYCQSAIHPKANEWEESPQLAIQFMKPGLTQGIVKPDQHVFRRKLNGKLANTDWLVKARGLV